MRLIVTGRFGIMFMIKEMVIVIISGFASDLSVCLYRVVFTDVKRFSIVIILHTMRMRRQLIDSQSVLLGATALTFGVIILIMLIVTDHEP